jgi:hypothetical protein
MDMSEQTAFEKRTRQLLDESTSRLDGRTRSRLTQARHAALVAGERPARRAWHSYVPLGAAAGVAVLAVALWLGQPEDGIGPVASNGGAYEDIDLLTDGDAPDFIVEGADLEFYEWAAGEVES